MGKARQIFVGALIIALGVAIIVAAVFFSDWSGQHRISWPGVAVGALVTLLGAAGLVWRLRR